MQLVYTSHKHVLVQATLDEGETLAELEGPLTTFVPVDGSNEAYHEIYEQGLPILDPLTGESAAPAVLDVDVGLDVDVEAADGSDNGNGRRSRKRKRR